MNSTPFISGGVATTRAVRPQIAREAQFPEPPHDFIHSQRSASGIRMEALLQESVHPLGPSASTERLHPILVEIKPIGGIQFRSAAHLEPGPQQHRGDRCREAEDIGPCRSNTTEKLLRSRVARIALAAGEGGTSLGGLRESDQRGRIPDADQDMSRSNGTMHQPSFVNVRQRLAHVFHQFENRLGARCFPAIKRGAIDVLLEEAHGMNSKTLSFTPQLPDPSNGGMVQTLTDLIFGCKTPASLFIIRGVPLDVLERLQGPVRGIRDEIRRDQILVAQFREDSMPHQTASKNRRGTTRFVFGLRFRHDLLSPSTRLVPVTNCTMTLEYNASRGKPRTGTDGSAASVWLGWEDWAIDRSVGDRRGQKDDKHVIDRVGRRDDAETTENIDH